MASHLHYLAAFNRLILPTISKLQRLLSPALEKAVQGQGLTLSEFRIVGLLMGEEQGYSQKELANQLGISSASMSVSINNLESKRWIQRIADANDQRVKRIIVSPSANFSDIAELIHQLEGQATKGIAKKDLKIAQQVLTKVIENISNQSLGN
jgi:DNA-binding MarR family transcriptional regulator